MEKHTFDDATLAGHCAVIVHFNNVTTEVKSVFREAFAELDWRGVNDGLATLSTSSDSGKAKGASLRTMLRDVTEGEFSIRAVGPKGAKKWCVAQSQGKRQKLPTLDKLIKAATVLVAEMKSVQGAGGFAAVHAEIARAVTELETPRSLEADYQLTRIRVIMDEAAERSATLNGAAEKFEAAA